MSTPFQDRERSRHWTVAIVAANIALVATAPATMAAAVTDQMLHPHQAHLMNFRTNLSAALSPRLDLTANAGWGRSVNYVEPDNVSIIGMLYTGQNAYGWKGCPAGTELTGCGMTGKS